MPKTINMLLSSAITAATLTVGGVAQATFSGGALTGTFSVTASLTSVFPGEAFAIRVVPGSEAGSGFSGLNSYRDVHWVQDFGDPTGTFELVTPPKGHTTARVAHSRHTVKAYRTPGVKTIKTTAYTSGMIRMAETTQVVTVLDPNAYAWDRVIYHDPSGVFAGIPADNGTTIRRTVTHADAVGWRSMWTDGHAVRIVLVDNTVMTMNSTSTINLGNGNGIVYMHNQSYGLAGKNQVWNEGTSSTNSVFNDGSTAATRTLRMAHCGLTINLAFNPQTAVGNQRNILSPAWISEAGGHKSNISMVSTCYKGFYNGISTGGNNIGVSTADMMVFFYDCDWGDHFDYCHFHGTGRLWAGMNGCKMLPHARTLAGDVKQGYMPDHAITSRWQNCFAGSTVNTWTGGASGWTGFMPDYAGQHAQRLVPHNASTGEQPEYVFIGVHSSGRFMFNIKDSNNEGLINCRAVLVEGCFFAGGRQGRTLADISTGGLYVRNNVFWIPKVATAAQQSLSQQIASFSFTSWPGTLFSNYIEFNTVVSDRTTTDGGADNYNDYTADGGYTIIAGNNAVEVPGHLNALSWPSTGGYSRADLFKPLTSNTVVGAVPSNDYRPVVDFQLVARPKIGTGVSNKGAYSTSVASAGSVAAPANTVAPSAPAPVPGNVQDYIFGHGTWTGITTNPHLGPLGAFMWNQRWYNGTPTTTQVGLQGTRYATAAYGKGFTLYGQVAYAGLGGQALSYVTTPGTAI